MQSEEQSDPLVSIIVITYNSSKYVLETLESAKAQTYPNIELIVTDDCSTDNTVEICNDWLEKNRERFVRIKLIKVTQNTGISANCNRGLNASQGQWVKLIAGDDILLKNCISDYIIFSKYNKNAYIIVGNHLSIKNKGIEKRYFNNCFQKLDAKQQLRYMIVNGSCILGAVPIIKKELFDRIGCFNEDYPYYEDTPFYIEASKANYRIYGLNKFCIKYRIHGESITNSVTNSLFINDFNKYSRNIIPSLALQEKMFLFYWHQKLTYFMNDRKQKIPFKYLLFRKLILACFDPFAYMNKFKRLKKFHCSVQTELCINHSKAKENNS